MFAIFEKLKSEDLKTQELSSIDKAILISTLLVECARSDDNFTDTEKEQIKNAVDRVVNKNLGNTGKWLNKYPNHCNTESRDFDNYIKMTTNSLGTGGEMEQNKIVKNIMKLE